MRLCVCFLLLLAAPASANVVTLANDHIARSWSVDADGVRATGLRGDREWAAPGPDFTLTLGEVPTSSVSVWTLASVERAEGSVTFRYTLPTGTELVRTFTLAPGASVIESHTTLATPVPVRVGAATLDNITAAADAPAEVLAFHGGTDWRDDYRVASKPTGAFDVEGQVARFGADAGWFLVSGHRGGAMWRAGRDATGRTYVGVDWPRDTFDWGPLRTDEPDYNRTENPLYPVPVRERLVPAGGTLDLGSTFAGVYSGGAPEAGFAFGEHLATRVAPRFPRTISISSWHPWSRGDGMSDANLRKQVDRAQALGIERLLLDDQWQGGAGGESGDWKFDTTRFPDTNGDGTPDFVDYVHAQGLEFGLWMAPLEFHTSSATYAAHPDWACTPTGQVTAQVPDEAGLGVWDVNNPAFREHLIGVIDRLVAQNDVREFKFDFMAWVDCPPHDYLDYEDAFVALVHELQRKHPDVTFELDETNDQRSWPFESASIGPSWFDNGHTHGSTQTAKLLHDLWSAAPWLPPSSIGFGALDGTLNATHGVDELLPMALLSHVTFWTDLLKLSDADSKRVADWLAWYRAHRETLAAGAYELTAEDPIDGKTWLMLQPWRGDRGVVFAFRQGSAEASRTVGLRGVEAGRDYVVTDARTGDVVARRSGAQLRAGFEVTLPANDAAVLQVDPVQ